MPKRLDRLAPRIKTAQVLFYVNAVVWVGLGTYLVIVMLRENNGLSAWLAGFFLFANAGAMLFSGINLATKEKWAFYFSQAVLILNALVTRIGQFGLFDQLALIFDIVIFGVLISFGRAYLHKS